MAGMFAVCRKELSDHLGSRRFLLLFGLILALSLLSAYQGAQFVRDNPSSVFIDVFSGNMGYSLAQILFYFGPIIGLSLGFDAINREKTHGSLSVLLSQPIFRDSIINGKFLAGIGVLSLVAVSTIGITSGVAIPLIGYGPGAEEAVRIVIFALVTILYLSGWMAMGLLFSTLTKKTTTSMLMSVSVWVFSVTIITIISLLLSNALVPVQFPRGDIVYVSEGTNSTSSMPSSPFNQSAMDEYMKQTQLRETLRTTINRISPATLYNEAIDVILANPYPPDVPSDGGTFPITIVPDGFGENTDMLTVWPQLTVLAVFSVVCFAASYMLFLRQEIRSGGI
jgi:ABC-2 type transport system permease protein